MFGAMGDGSAERDGVTAVARRRRPKPVVVNASAGGGARRRRPRQDDWALRYRRPSVTTAVSTAGEHRLPHKPETGVAAEPTRPTVSNHDYSHLRIHKAVSRADRAVAAEFNGFGGKATFRVYDPDRLISTCSGAEAPA